MPVRLRDWRRVGKLITLASGLVMAAFAVMVIPPWILAFLTTARVRQLTLGLLVGLEFAYAMLVTGSLIGIAVLGVIFWRARRGGMSRPWVARGLLLCGSCFTGLALAEAIVATWGVPVRSLPAAPTHEPELPSQFAARDDSEVTLVVVGESSAAGAPFQQWLSVGQIVAWQLGEAIPGSRFRALVLAKPGDVLEGQYRKLSQLRRAPMP